MNRKTSGSVSLRFFVLSMRKAPGEFSRGFFRAMELGEIQSLEGNSLF